MYKVVIASNKLPGKSARVHAWNDGPGDCIITFTFSDNTRELVDNVYWTRPYIDDYTALKRVVDNNNLTELIFEDGWDGTYDRPWEDSAKPLYDKFFKSWLSDDISVKFK